MKCSLFFPWRKKATKVAAQEVPTLWMRQRPAASLRSQHLSPRHIRDSMGIIERQFRACPIAPMQEQMQTVWFTLVHEYIKNKKNGGNDANTRT